MKTIHRGNAAEAAVLAAFTRADIPALLPFGQGLAFDLAAVVPPDGAVIRIQVKAGAFETGASNSTPVRLDQPKNNQRRRIRLAADYEFERWVKTLSQTG